MRTIAVAGGKSNSISNPGRRRVARSLIATSAAAAWPALARDNASGQKQTTDQTATQAFASSFAAVPDSFGPTQLSFVGHLPEQLNGTLFRNGPAVMQRGATHYRHWFDGDGMVHSFQFANGRLAHQARLVRTQRNIEEHKAGRFLYNGFATSFEDSRPTTSPDSLNVANISVLPLAGSGEILALWEAGSAYRIDRKTLATKGRKVWSAQTDGAPFSAHPRVDADGRIWNFGYLSGSGKLVIYDIAVNGKLSRTALLDMPNADMVHDFAVTKTHLVFVLSPLKFMEVDGSFRHRLQWQPDQASLLVLVDKHSLKQTHRFEMSPFFFFHLGNAWNEGDHTHVQVMQAPGFDVLMNTIESATLGEAIAHLPKKDSLELIANRRGGDLKTIPMPLTGAEFPAFDPRFTGIRTQRLVAMTRSATMPDEVFGFNAVSMFDQRTGRVTAFDYGSDIIAEEHLLVPGKGQEEGKGWIVGTAYHWRKKMTAVNVFNPDHLIDGPLASAFLPYGLPLGLHGKFIPS